MKPYEADASRVRAMYRLLAPPSGGRTMEVCFDSAPNLAAPDWRGEHVAWMVKAATPYHGTRASGHYADPQWLPAMPEGHFDLIVLHRTLDRLAAADAAACDTGALEGLFRLLYDRLVQGGILVVTVANGAWLSRLRRGRPAGEPKGKRDCGVQLSWRSLQRLFAAAGFVKVHSYNVLPDADAPLRLVDTDADLSRVGFRRELAFMRSSLPLRAYLLRRVAAELALNRHFEDWLLTSGARP